MSIAEAENIAQSLTKSQRAMASGEYDFGAATLEDASALVKLGLWSWTGEGEDSQFHQFDITPVGLAVRAHLLNQDTAHD